MVSDLGGFREGDARKKPQLGEKKFGVTEGGGRSIKAKFGMERAGGGTVAGIERSKRTG